MATTTDKYYREVDPAQNALEVTRKRAELLGRYCAIDMIYIT